MVKERSTNPNTGIWERDGNRVAERYRQMIRDFGVQSPKSIGWRSDSKSSAFFYELFRGISLRDGTSILDVGCGRGELLDYIRITYPTAGLGYYLGIDLVPEFLDYAKTQFPAFDFQRVNFVSSSFEPDRRFTIVVALGVLVSRVTDYEEYVKYSIRKMIRMSFGMVFFNLVSRIDADSENYRNCDEIGETTTFDREELEVFLSRIPDISYHIHATRVFPDAVDLFVQIRKRQGAFED